MSIGVDRDEDRFLFKTLVIVLLCLLIAGGIVAYFSSSDTTACHMEQDNKITHIGKVVCE